MRALIAIVGPTAVGKTDLAMALAERMAVEVVNADSRQVYRYMDIGTGKPSKDDRARVEHHLIDVANPDEDFSLATYLHLADDALETVASRGHIPLIVGGTGLYLWSLVERWQIPEVPPDMEYRKSIEDIAAKRGHAAVHDELARIDAVAAARIHPRNVRRVIRALELFRATGTLPSELLSRKGPVPPGSVIIGLGLDRARLFAKADARVDRMIGQGLQRVLACDDEHRLPGDDWVRTATERPGDYSGAHQARDKTSDTKATRLVPPRRRAYYVARLRGPCCCA
jgi:tRNA dimethylallyltransferase